MFTDLLPSWSSLAQLFQLPVIPGKIIWLRGNMFCLKGCVSSRPCWWCHVICDATIWCHHDITWGNMLCLMMRPCLDNHDITWDHPIMRQYFVPVKGCTSRRLPMACTLHSLPEKKTQMLKEHWYVLASFPGPTQLHLTTNDRKLGGSLEQG